MALKPKSTPQKIKLDDLILDTNNPRFAELYSESSSEEDLISYLLYNEAAEEVAKRIVNVGEFYPDRPLWVIKKGKKYLVKDGNRRCAAVKALQMPDKYKLELSKTIIPELPVLLYKNLSDIQDRIVEEHAGNLFRKWERIAKSIEVLKLADEGKWDEAQDLDSKPGDLIKLASFYKEAVLYGGDDLRRLLRRGRGTSGGKTIIFERLFRDAKICGYQFKKSPSFRIEIKDSSKFGKYITALVKYLKKHPGTKTDTIDNNKNFIKLLKDYGFDAYAKTSFSATSNGSSTSGTSSSTSDGAGSTGSSSGAGSSGSSNSDSSSGSATGNGTGNSNSSRGSVKKYPNIKRKKLPPGINGRIKEYFDIDPLKEPNSKIAMARITFECVLKHVVENTKFNGRTNMSKSGFFGKVYSKAPYTDFTLMKTKFTELILNTGKRTAFIAFDLDTMHIIVHDYLVNGISANGEQISNNLMPLIEFMLQSESDLISSLDISKL